MARSFDPDVVEAAERALRALQMYDEVIPGVMARELLLEAESGLGEILGLDCTGVAEPGGFDHSGGTCPIHEWLYHEDHDEAHRRYPR